MSHTSTEVFAIATKYEIPLQPGRSAPLSDEAFAAFEGEYRQWAEKRDQELARHLVAISTPFRIFLGYSPEVFNIASQLIWYVDEVVTRDPIAGALDNHSTAIEQRKQDLRSILQIMAQFRHAIDAGYLLLYTTPLVGGIPQEAPQHLVTLARSPEVRAAVEQSAYCGYVERQDGQGRPIGVYQIRLESGGTVGFNLKDLTVGPGEWTSPPFSPLEVLPRVGPDALKAIAGPDVFDKVDAMVAREAQRALLVLEASKKVGAAVVFTDPLKPVLVEHTGAHFEPHRQLASIQVLNIAAPYLKDIPPERLQEARSAAPAAFLDFRSRLVEIVTTAIKNGPGSEMELQATVDRSVLPALNALEVEARAEAKRGRIVGYGTPLAVALGGLIGTSLGINPSALLGVAAVAGPIKAAADYAASRDKLAAFPFYFLWKARGR